jgi:hypothetical protein
MFDITITMATIKLTESIFSNNKSGNELFIIQCRVRESIISSFENLIAKSSIKGLHISMQ